MTRNSPLTLDQFAYELPDSQIAREPVRPRDASRLLLIDRQAQRREDSLFTELPHHLRPGDCLVLNDARVLKARVKGRLERTGRDVELLFAVPLTADTWKAMVRPSRRVRPGDTIVFDDGSKVQIEPDNGSEGSLRTVRTSADTHAEMLSLIDANGTLPLPPYINRPAREEDAIDYQTTFAATPGAIAAPTAGLHFTDGVLDALIERRIDTVTLTLHVGIGTFLPIRTDDPREHVLTPERYELSAAAAEALNAARDAGRRIIAVGTTTTRTLEHIYQLHGRFRAGHGETGLYILPGHRFQAIDGLLTNFHLPRSTLLMMVAAFAGRELVMDAYQHAVSSGYRFYSFGDCCLIF